MNAQYPLHVQAEKRRLVDALIVTAVREEYDEVIAVQTGAWPGTTWEEDRPDGVHAVSFRTFLTAGGHPLRVAVTRATAMGGVASTNAAQPYIEKYKPRCLAMCGFCAGRRGKVQLGDVLIADRVWQYDFGAVEVSYSADGDRTEHFQADITTYQIPATWIHIAEKFHPDPAESSEWLKQRPIPYDQQFEWILERVFLHEAPAEHPERRIYCPDWTTLLKRHWTQPESEWMLTKTLELTAKGEEHVRHVSTVLYPDGLPSQPAFRVRTGVIATGNQVIRDERIFDRLADVERKVLGLEMEAAAIGAVAHVKAIPHLIVMKGVMDYADPDKNDNFKQFAARASAECLLAFLRQHLPVETVPDLDDILVSGIISLPPDPPPSALLDAHCEAIPFQELGWTEVLEELDRWCDQGPTVSVRLLHADGGVGKTRLAIEWIRRRRAAGWAAGLLAKSVPNDWLRILWDGGQPVLVVIDYAESRPDVGTQLERALRYRQQQEGRSLRETKILLLARNADDWWESLRATGTDLRAWLDEIPPMQLPALAVSELERELVFRESADRFAMMLGAKTVPSSPIVFTDDRFERVLYLHMAALAAAAGLAFEPDSLMDVVLDHEERFWELRSSGGTRDAVDLSMRKSLARQLVAAATLRGGLLTHGEALNLTQRLLARPLDREDEKLLHVLHRIYQQARATTGAYLPGLEPDLLGECTVLRVASPRLREDTLPEEWIDRVFSADDQDHAIRTGLEVLGRASALNASAMRRWIERMLAGSLAPRALLALEAAKSVGRRTAFSVLGDVLADQLEARGDLASATALSAAGIPNRTVSLRRVAEWRSRTLIRSLPSPGDARTLATRLRLTQEHIAELVALGRYREVLVLAQDFVSVCRKSSERNPNLLPHLPLALNGLGAILGKLERPREALEATAQAVSLHRKLVERDPSFLPNLCHSVSNMGACLMDLKLNKEAKRPTRDAVKTARKLADGDPDFLPVLAANLNNFGRNLAALKRYPESLDALHESVALRRGLAKQNADAFMPDLATSLVNWGAVLLDVERYKEALDVTIDAVKIRRALARKDPEVFLRDLARSLDNWGNCLSALDRNAEALEPLTEALKIRRGLPQQNQDVVLAEIAASLNNLSVALKRLERHREALTALEEGLEIIWPLFERSPGQFMENTETILVKAKPAYVSAEQTAPPSLAIRLAAFEQFMVSRR